MRFLIPLVAALGLTACAIPDVSTRPAPESYPALINVDPMMRDAAALGATNPTATQDDLDTRAAALRARAAALRAN
ncbi:hypothetical protein [Ketogulonicigenium vulgare]|uniref:hypothetical protein n=1 Tax=Ketogulonicigenium vulgare TaxID=92945 RepID=UPI0023580CC5|nr:hypothetical protein [Ketogulonicigenium vulgare]